jgi:hypothetical protein
VSLVQHYELLLYFKTFISFSRAMIRYLFSFSLVLLVPEANQREQFRFQSTIQKLELLFHCIRSEFCAEDLLERERERERERIIFVYYPRNAYEILHQNSEKFACVVDSNPNHGSLLPHIVTCTPDIKHGIRLF